MLLSKQQMRIYAILSFICLTFLSVQKGRAHFSEKNVYIFSYFIKPL